MAFLILIWFHQMSFQVVVTPPDENVVPDETEPLQSDQEQEAETQQEQEEPVAKDAGYQEVDLGEKIPDVTADASNV